MKKMMKFGLVMVALLAMAVSTFANTTDFSVRVNDNIGKTIRFSVMNTPLVHLSLVSQDGEVLFQEDISAIGAISRQYDLKDFPAGNYQLKAETVTKMSLYDIEVNGSTAVISKTPSAETVKPVLVNKNGKVSLSIINPTTTPISIALYDAANNELYLEETAGKLSLIKMFDFNQVSQGEYTFVTKFGNQTFINRVVAGK